MGTLHYLYNFLIVDLNCFKTVLKNKVYLKHFYETNKHWQLNLFTEKTGVNGVFDC